MKMRFKLALALVLMPLSLTAQDRAETLADIRQELTVLHVEVQKLRRELSTTGAANVAVGGSTLQRLDAIESELSRVTSKAEQLEFRINSVVTDGTNRIGDLEFRLVELEGGDIGKLGETSTLGGEAQGASNTAPAAPSTNLETGMIGNDVELAVGEKADFEAAKAALDGGSFEEAAKKFAVFNESYPGGPMAVQAYLMRGAALSKMGDKTGEARAYLQGFTADPEGPEAPQALFRLGDALAQLGQTQEACVTLAEVGVRFPGAAAVEQAQTARARIGCQ